MNVSNSIYHRDRDWAYDINKDPIFGGELKNMDVINQSIEMILGTLPGERLFNPMFGSGLQFKIFEGMTEGWGERLLEEIINQIKLWEDRITILDSNVKMIVNIDQHSVVLIIPYIVNRNGAKGIFKKKVFV